MLYSVNTLSSESLLVLVLVLRIYKFALMVGCGASVLGQASARKLATCNCRQTHNKSVSKGGIKKKVKT